MRCIRHTIVALTCATGACSAASVVQDERTLAKREPPPYGEFGMSVVHAFFQNLRTRGLAHPPAMRQPHSCPAPAPARITRRTAGLYLAAASPLLGGGLLACATPAPLAEPAPPDIVVAADGSGQFRSVHAAVQSIPAANRERIVIYVKEGVYRERARVDAPFVTLRGQSRLGTRIEFAHPASAPVDANGRAVLDIGPLAHDLVIENLTIHNSNPQLGQHAFAILGRADRTLIQDCELLGIGNDTLALWRGFTTPEERAAGLEPAPAKRPAQGGRYYHARLHITGAVDFVCPRGWCYMVDSLLEQKNPSATASMWHDGREDPSKKFVMRGCRFDGPPGWYLARRHHDGHLIFIDCRFSERMRDQPPYRVTFPLGGGTPSAADVANNQRYDATNRFADRFHYHGCRRDGGDYAWHRDNLHSAAGAPRPEQVTARWTFGGSWDPERLSGPAPRERVLRRDGFELVFDEPVTAKRQPGLRLPDGSVAVFEGGSGTARLAWRTARPVTNAALSAAVLAGGQLLGTEAATSARPARLALAA